MFKLKADLNHSEQWKGFYVQRPQGEEQKRRDEAVSRERTVGEAKSPRCGFAEAVLCGE